jgi:hemerythrin-like metal-binding protein
MRRMKSQSEATPWKLEWTQELSVYIPEIDAEHQRFIHLVNELNRAIIGRMKLEEIQKRMQAILDDAATHFAHEEELFSEWGYTEANEHANQHRLTVLALLEIMKDFTRSGLEHELIEAGAKVKGALITHILVEDMKYRDYFRKKNLND